MKLTKYILFALIVNCSLLIVNCLSQQWTIYNTTNSGLPSNSIASIAFDTNNVKWIGTVEGLARFNGTSWTVYDTVNSPIPHDRVLSLTVDKDNIIWLGTNGGGAAKFDGLNWAIYDTNNSPIRSNIVMDIAIDENNIKWFCTTRGLAKFDNINWTIYNTTNSGLPGNQTECIVLEDSIKWVGTLNNGVAKYDNANWVNYTFQNSGLPSNNIFGITVDYLGNKWIATMFGGVAKFNSVLNQWTVFNTTNSGLPNNHNNTVLTQNHIKWVGSWGGLAKYNDTSWVVFDPTNSPMPEYYVTSLSLDNSGKLWIGTLNGLAVYNTGIIGIHSQNSNIPKSFILKQNYPNPFNPITTIEYELYKSAHVSLKIYDVLGNLISSIIDSKQFAGEYKINFESNGLSTGVYFYILETNGYTESKKMILIK